MGEMASQRVSPWEWAPATVPGRSLNWFEIFQMVPKMIESCSNLIQFKTDIPEVKKIGLKYGWNVL
jgi:hypothetical protein